MHFFNPVDKMPLVEVIAGARTSPAAVATVAAFARRLGKTPVPVKDGPGFLVNRLLGFYSVEALQLLGEGYKIDDLDAAMTDWGMPVGPFVLTDEVGIDVAIEVAHVLHAAFADRLPLPAWVDRPVADGRLGRKNGRGFYVYRGGERRGPDPAVYAALGVETKIAEPDRRYLAERMVLPMVNEAARCLAEGGGGGRRRSRPGADHGHRLPALPRRALPLGRRRGAGRADRYPGALRGHRRRALPAGRRAAGGGGRRRFLPAILAEHPRTPPARPSPQGASGEPSSITINATTVTLSSPPRALAATIRLRQIASTSEPALAWWISASLSIVVSPSEQSR